MDIVRFIHAADFHMGRFFPYKNDFFLERGRDDRLRTFQKMLQIGRDRKVNMIFLVGDILEQDVLRQDDITTFLSMIQENPEIQFFYLFGNHDYELYEEFSLRSVPNLFLFPPGKMTFYDDENLKVRIMGKSWDRFSRKCQLSGQDVQYREGYRNLLLHHGTFSGQDYFPLILTEWELSQFDYIALGHVHKGERYGEKVIMVGTPEPLDHEDVGEKGIIYGEMKQSTQTLFIPIAARKIFPIEISLSDEDNFSTARKKLQERVESIDDIYSVLFSGNTLDNSIIRALEREFLTRGIYVKIEQILGANYDFKAIYERHRGDFLGEYLKRVDEQPLNLEDKRKLMAYGVQGLLRTEYENNTGGTH